MIPQFEVRRHFTRYIYIYLRSKSAVQEIFEKLEKGRVRKHGKRELNG